MRITPEQFDTIFKIFILVILCFFGFVALQILMIKARWRDGARRRKSSPRDAAETFGLSGMSASDMSTLSGDFSSGDTGGSISSGGDSGGGGGDFTGGGGEGGGGGASGGWND